MNVKKYPEPDPDFYLKIRGAARNDYERGMVYILQHTGMHVSSLVSLKPENLDDKGWLSWRRPKNRKPMRSLIPPGDLMTCQIWISQYGQSMRGSRAIQYKIKEIGDRAGYPGLSPMSFRAQYAITMLDDGMQPHEVKHMLGCSLDTLMNHYAQIQAARLVMDKKDPRSLGYLRRSQSLRMDLNPAPDDNESHQD